MLLFLYLYIFTDGENDSDCSYFFTIKICAQIWEYMLQNEKYDEDGHVVDDGFNMEDYPQDVQPKELVTPCN